MVQSTSGTLIRPPPNDPSKSIIENVLELTPLTDIGPDIFTNTRPLWHPPGARGIYGGAAIAQSLAAAQLTIPDPSAANAHASFLVHSMHCYFVLAGDSSIPVLYHVERVREGRSFMTRTVQARQRGRCIFTTTVSFMREGSGGEEVVRHEVGLPEKAERWLEEIERMGEDERDGLDDERTRRENEGLGAQALGPFESRRMEISNGSSPHPHTKRTYQWVKCRGHLSSSAPQPHLSALAYMSDSYFIGTISRVHGLWRFGRRDTKKALDSWNKSLAPSPSSAKTAPSSSSRENSTQALGPTAEKTDIDGTDPAQPDPYRNVARGPNPSTTTPAPTPTSTSTSLPSSETKDASLYKELSDLEALENSPTDTRTIGMMVSLDHAIFFHRPRGLRADDWLLSEMESPWTGDGRGVVLQRIWDRRG
ncbi:MAG: hypothetical protein LQ340_003871, partial [Diploschistes diacapsis]